MEDICANCGIRIKWQPTIVDGNLYCCLGCAMGGPCSCDYSNLPSLGEFRAIACERRVIFLAAASDKRQPPATDENRRKPELRRDEGQESAGTRLRPARP
jgi:hypothetical protein